MKIMHNKLKRVVPLAHLGNAEGKNDFKWESFVDFKVMIVTKILKEKANSHTISRIEMLHL